MIRLASLCCGIGGGRQAIEQAATELGLKFKSVFSCDYDKFSQKTYLANFNVTPFGDLYTLRGSDVPDHDILSAGFPCQPFSIAGVSKKNSLNRPHGFDDKKQGTVFFEILRIIEAKKPRSVLLENVKNLLSHDGGKTIAVIVKALRDAGYFVVKPRILDAIHLLPQHRERVFLIAFSEKAAADRFKWPEIPDIRPKLSSILESNVDPKYTMSDKLWASLQRHAARHLAKGSGFGFGLTDGNGTARTLSARYYKDGSEILIRQEGNPRRLTPRECARLQGFPETFKIVCSDTQAYKQFGNSVPIPLVKLVAKAVINALRESMSDHIEFIKVSSKEFRKAIDNNFQFATLTDASEKDLESYQKFTLLLNGQETGIYYGISPDGELAGVINNGEHRNTALRLAVPDAISNGARHLNAWDVNGKLQRMYASFGFTETHRVPYDSVTYGEPPNDLKDAWRVFGWQDGQSLPSVSYMVRP